MVKFPLDKVSAAGMNSNTNPAKNSLTLIGLIRIFSVMLAALSTLTLFDSHHRFLELFSHFKLQYLLASLIFMSIFVVTRERKWATVMMAIFLLNLSYVLPWYFDSKPNPHQQNQLNFLKILHSNVQTSNKSYSKLIELVLEESPDIVTVQEVNNAWINELEKIESLLPHKLVRTREDNFGIAIFSKYPFNTKEFLYLGNSTVPSLKIGFSIDNQQVTLITTHPVPPVSTEYYKSRNTQLNELSILSRNVDEPLIVVGDLNVTMWSHAYRSLGEKTELLNTRRGIGILPTWPSNLLPFMIPIDHCLVSKEFNVLDMRIGRDIGSDHLPLIIDLELRH